MGIVTFYAYYLLSKVLDHCEKAGRRHIRFRELAADVLGTSSNFFFFFFVFVFLFFIFCFQNFLKTFFFFGFRQSIVAFLEAKTLRQFPVSGDIKK